MVDTAAAPVRSVMVVDDNEDMARSLALLLAEMGHHVCQASDARTALLLAAQFKPDVILVDLVMPRMDGIELAEALRQVDGVSGTRIIGMSGYPADHWHDQMAHAGLDGFVSKPLTAAQLAGILSGPDAAREQVVNA